MAAHSTAASRCYYDILGVNKSASTDEIRRGKEEGDGRLQVVASCAVGSNMRAVGVATSFKGMIANEHLTLSLFVANRLACNAMHAKYLRECWQPPRVMMIERNSKSAARDGLAAYSWTWIWNC